MKQQGLKKTGIGRLRRRRKA